MKNLETILAEKLKLEQRQVRMLARLQPQVLPQLEENLRLLDDHGLLEDVCVSDIAALCCSAPALHTAQELRFAIQVPQMLNFSPEQRREYEKNALHWGRFTDIRPTVLPLLERLCGEQTAWRVLCGLYISSNTTVDETRAVQICEALLSYPCEEGQMTAYMELFWYFLFSIYSDPIAALAALSEVFKREHVLTVFTDRTDLWSYAYYRDVAPIQAEKEQARQQLLQEAKEKFKDCLK